MARKRHHRRGPPSNMPIICIAFGVGIMLSFCFSLKLALFLAAFLLIIMGYKCADGC